MEERKVEREGKESVKYVSYSTIVQSELKAECEVDSEKEEKEESRTLLSLFHFTPPGSHLVGWLPRNY